MHRPFRVGRGGRPCCSVGLPLSPKEGDAGVANLQAGRGGLVHRAVGGLLARAAEPGRRRGDLPGRGRRGAIALRLRFPEMSERHSAKATRMRATDHEYRQGPGRMALQPGSGVPSKTSRRRSGARRTAQFGKIPSCWRLTGRSWRRSHAPRADVPVGRIRRRTRSRRRCRAAGPPAPDSHRAGSVEAGHAPFDLTSSAFHCNPLDGDGSDADALDHHKAPAYPDSTTIDRRGIDLTGDSVDFLGAVGNQAP